MAFNGFTAATRFGCGLSPEVGPPASVDEMLRLLAGRDWIARKFPVSSFDSVSDKFYSRAKLRGERNRLKPESRRVKEIQREIGRIDRAVTREHQRYRRAMILRRIHTQDGLRERLVSFWADHLTARGRDVVLRSGSIPFAEDAIRPHIAGNFSTMLIAAVTHPLMLRYLDQTNSVGPNSPLANKRSRVRGINENLARELLELHTLGVDGPYRQEDVRELAKLLTGLAWNRKKGAHFNPGYAEPGSKTVLGHVYGRRAHSYGDIKDALRRLAVHPATARYLARKLVIHFIADDPPPQLVDAVAAAYVDSGGELLLVYRALLEHPLAWDTRQRNIKQPLDFLTSSLRALGVQRFAIESLGPRHTHDLLSGPLEAMGQPLGQPPGPDGWPEEDDNWLTPQGVAARLQWAMVAPKILMGKLPDPRDFVHVALGPGAPANVIRAAHAAESRHEGVGLVLISPAFQRH